MFFNSVKEINGLLSKRMSDIYLKATIEKNWRSQNFDFLSLKNLSPVFGKLQLTQILPEFSNLLFQLKNQRSGSKTVCSFYILLVLKRIMTL